MAWPWQEQFIFRVDEFHATRKCWAPGLCMASRAVRENFLWHRYPSLLPSSGREVGRVSLSPCFEPPSDLERAAHAPDHAAGGLVLAAHELRAALQPLFADAEGWQLPGGPEDVQRAPRCARHASAPLRQGCPSVRAARESSGVPYKRGERPLGSKVWTRGSFITCWCS